MNGKPEGSLNLPGPFNSSPLPFFVGANPNLDGSPACLFNGIIEQVRVSNQRDIAVISIQRNSSGPTSKPVLYRFDRGTNLVAPDASGHNHGGKSWMRSWPC